MATNRLQVRLDAVDNTKRAFGSLRSSIFNLRNALATVGVGVFAKQIVDTGRQVENLSTRFKFLFGSAAEGSKAFDTLTNFASKVPFSLEEISAASGNLAVVSKDADELSKILEITGNVAAVTGLDFQTTASQIQRSFAGGIAAADIFREKGVRSLLGFEAGATITAEETIKKFEEVFGKGGRFGNATDELAQTFDGTLSMLGDKLFKFKKDTAEAQFFNALKIELEDLNNFIEKNEETIKQFTISVGNFLASAVRALSDAVNFLRENIDFILEGFRVLIGLGVAKILATMAIAFRSLAVAIGTATAATLTFNKALLKNVFIASAAFVLGNLDRIIKKFKELARSLGIISDLEDDTFDEGDSISGTGDAVEKVNEKLTVMQQVLEQIKKAYEEVFGTTPKKALEDFGGAVKKAFEGIQKSIGDAVAQAIVFGKTFNDVFKAALRQVLANFISQLVTIGIQLILNSKLVKDFVNALKGIFKEQHQQLNNQNRLNSMLAIELGLRAAIAAFTGGGGGGFGFGAEGGKVKGMRADGGSVAGNAPYIVGERGRELFIPNTDGEIVSNENMQKLGTSVHFTINATDVKGVKELLIDNRATIVNIINGALNQKGKQALV